MGEEGMKGWVWERKGVKGWVWERKGWVWERKGVKGWVWERLQALAGHVGNDTQPITKYVGGAFGTGGEPPSPPQPDEVACLPGWATMLL